MTKQKSTLWRALSVLLVIFLLCVGSQYAHAEKKPWAKYTADDKTLSFYYGEKSSLDDNEYWLTRTGSRPEFAWLRDKVEHVKFDPSFADARPTDCQSMFLGVGMYDIQGIEYFNTSEVTTMYEMFSACKNLTELDLSHFDTSKVTDMGAMFDYCPKLKSINLRGFNTKNVSTMQEMFRKCESLTSIDGLSSFDTSKVTTFENMFYNCKSIESLDLSSFDTRNVTNMKYMFSECSKLTTLDLRSFDTSKVTTMDNMFDKCSNLETIVTNFSAASTKERARMFCNCSSLKYIYVGEDFIMDNDPYSVAQYAIFENCTSLHNYVPADISKATFIPDGYFCKIADYGVKLAEANYDSNDKSLNFSYDYKVDIIMNGCTALVNEGLSEQEWPDDVRKNTQKVVFDSSYADYRPKSCAGLFRDFSLLHEIEGLENFNTTDVTSMENMFKRCTSIKELDLSRFKTDNVLYMNGMFYGCSALTELDLSAFKTDKVINMAEMFSGCSKIATLDLSNFHAGNVLSMGGMFEGCSALTKVDLSNFENKNTQTLTDMFHNCSSLEMLNLANFYTYHAESMNRMFGGCSKLKRIYANEDYFSVTGLCTSYLMFSGCEKLPGYDENSVDGTKACYVSKGGYLYNSNDYIRPWVHKTDGTLTFNYGLKVDEDMESGKDFLLNDAYHAPEWIGKRGTSCSDVTTVVFDKSFAQARPTNCFEWFYKFTSLTTIEGLEYLNTSEVTKMASMFINCTSLETLDLSMLDTRNVTDMSHMFDNCTSLKTLNISKLNTENVTDMIRMFYNCSSLASLDLSHFNTEKVKHLIGMFEKCSSLTSLDLTQFDIHNVESMVWMFYDCPLLKSVYISDKFVAKEGVECDNPFKGSPACFNCLPSQYDAVKGNVFADYIKPYVNINAKAPYGTFCVPIGGTLAEGSFSGFDKLYRVKGADKEKGTITLEAAKSIEPGVAYVYRRNLPEDATESIITFTADNDVASVAEPQNEDNLLKGTFQSIIAPAKSYLLQTDGNFHPVADGNKTLKVGAYRAYLDLGTLASEAGAKAYSMTFEDGEATGIDGINADNTDNGICDNAAHSSTPVYDLMGRRVNAPVKGNIYIVNGKKIMCK